MLPKGTHDYAGFIRPSGLSTGARHAGLDIAGLRGMSYNPITQHYSLGDDVSVNYLIHTQLSK
jgi:2-polyprenyl-6-hydroxyphenyl methylase/3-demethylubiquinone-9 3-methyltransferase